MGNKLATNSKCEFKFHNKINKKTLTKSLYLIKSGSADGTVAMLAASKTLCKTVFLSQTKSITAECSFIPFSFPEKI